MRKKARLKKILISGLVYVCLLAAVAVFSGCPSMHTALLYLSSSLTGKVYTFDLAANVCSANPLFDYGTDAGDGVFFFYDRGYIASASFTDPKLITFNPGASTISPSIISHTWIAGPWDLLAVDRTKAYVTDVGNYGENDGGVYYFNPTVSGPVFRKVSGTEANCQGMVYLGKKKKIYVANSGKDTVSVIDTATNTETKEVDVETNPTNIVSLADGSRVYVICTNYSGNSTLIQIDTTSDTVTRSFSITRGAQAISISGGNIYYTGLDASWANTGPFYIDVSEASPVEREIETVKKGGSNSLVYRNRLYITQPDLYGGQSTLTVIDLSNNTEINGSPFDIGAPGDGITGIAVY